MTHKSADIAQRVARFQGQELDARYLGFFDCFNRELFYESHDVLEDLWLLDRKASDGDFYKGLIQLAGAFVHLQKGRPQPAIALLKLSKTYLSRYPALHHQLDLTEVIRMSSDWEERIGQIIAGQSPSVSAYPKLQLTR